MTVETAGDFGRPDTGQIGNDVIDKDVPERLSIDFRWGMTPSSVGKETLPTWRVSRV